MTHTDYLLARLRAEGVSCSANDNIARALSASDLVLIEEAAEAAVAQLLRALLIDVDNDHNTRGTAKRVAKMYVREVFRGRYEPPPSTTDFPNARKLDEVYTLGPITVRSACSHHLVPIVGRAWIGVLPSDRVIGISKFVRLVEWVMARPQIQEEAAVMLADELEQRIAPRGLAVVIKAQHLCMTWRGVRETGTEMTTSVMRGTFRNDAAARDEFLRLIERGAT